MNNQVAEIEEQELPYDALALLIVTSDIQTKRDLLELCHVKLFEGKDYVNLMRGFELIPSDGLLHVIEGYPADIFQFGMDTNVNDNTKIRLCNLLIMQDGLRVLAELVRLVNPAKADETLTHLDNKITDLHTLLLAEGSIIGTAHYLLPDYNTLVEQYLERL